MNDKIFQFVCRALEQQGFEVDYLFVFGDDYKIVGEGAAFNTHSHIGEKNEIL